MSLPTLSPEQSEKPPGFEFRMALLFAAIFVPLGIHVPYFPLWLEANGFDPGQISLILSMPLFLRVLTTPFITAAADRADDRVNVLIAVCAATVAISAGYFLPARYATVLAVSLALTIIWTPQSPLADSLALSGVRRFGSSYPAMRIWGSISYLVANLTGGVLLSIHGPTTVPWMITGGVSLAFLASMVAPRLGRPRIGSPLSVTELQKKGPSLLTPYFLTFVSGAGLIMASHGFLNGFVSIYWRSIGLEGPTIGVLWAWAVVAEVCTFLGFRRLFGNVPATRVVAIAGAGAIVRWVLFPWVWPTGTGLVGFFAVQTLHAVSTALILIGVQKLIGELIPDQRTGAAQGMYFFASGVFSAGVTWISGPLYEAFGIDGFYAMAVIAAAGLALTTCARLLEPRSIVR